MQGRPASADGQGACARLAWLALTLPAPSNAAEREQLTKLSVMMESEYGKGKY